MIVYSISGESALEVSYGNSVFFIASENLRRDQNKIQFHIQNCRDMMGISEVNTVVQRLFSSGYFYRCGNYFACAGKKGLIIDKNFKSFPASHKLKVNYILLTQNAGVKLHDINAMYDYEMLILDKSNSAYRTRKWKKETDEVKIHIMAEKGALIINL